MSKRENVLDRLDEIAKILSDNRQTTDSGLPVQLVEVLDANAELARDVRRAGTEMLAALRSTNEQRVPKAADESVGQTADWRRGWNDCRQATLALTLQAQSIKATKLMRSLPKLPLSAMTVSVVKEGHYENLVAHPTGNAVVFRDDELFTQEQMNEHALQAIVGYECFLSKVLHQIRFRLHFMGWPAEPYWNANPEGKPNWIPDWRYEIQLIEHALFNSDLTAEEKPTDTKPLWDVVRDSQTRTAKMREMIEQWKEPEPKAKPMESCPECGQETCALSCKQRKPHEIEAERVAQLEALYAAVSELPLEIATTLMSIEAERDEWLEWSAGLKKVETATAKLKELDRQRAAKRSDRYVLLTTEADIETAFQAGREIDFNSGSGWWALTDIAWDRLRPFAQANIDQGKYVYRVKEKADERD